MFTSSRNHGFSMQFKNGITISVQWGAANYCDRRNITTSYRGDMDAATPHIKSTTAEIAIWDREGVWFDFGSDQVKGWCSTDEVADWIWHAQSAQDLKHLHELAINACMIGS